MVTMKGSSLIPILIPIHIRDQGRDRDQDQDRRFILIHSIIRFSSLFILSILTHGKNGAVWVSGQLFFGMIKSIVISGDLFLF